MRDRNAVCAPLWLPTVLEKNERTSGRTHTLICAEIFDTQTDTQDSHLTAVCY